MKIIMLGMACVLIVAALGMGIVIGRNWDTVKKIESITASAQAYNFLKDNGIQIWGVEGCSWCQKQREEFGEWLDNTIYVNCQESQPILDKCVAFESGTPFWVKDNEVIHAGYIPIDNIKEVLEEKI